MNDILRFLKANEAWIYILLGLVGLIPLRNFIVGLREWQGTIFGLERDIAQRKLTGAISLLVLLTLMAAAEFFITSFIFPTVPDVELLPTETLTVLTTPTVTLPVVSGISPTEQISTALPQSTAVTAQASGCIAGKFEITFPKPTDDVSGVVEIKGTVAVPNLGFYKYEYSQPGSKTWITIAAGNGVKVNDVLGNWDTSQLSPGDYLLHIVAYDNKGAQMPACETPVKIVASSTSP